MVNLDDLSVYRRLDPANMLEHLYGLPRQCHTAWHKAKDFNLPQDYVKIDKVVVLGMGGSAIGGSLLRNFVSRLTKPIIFVTRDYDPPAFIDDKTLVIASSYSGNTEETLSAYTSAQKRGAKIIVLSSNGKLLDLAIKDGVPFIRIPGKLPPRCALAYGTIPFINLFSKLGLITQKTKLTKTTYMVM